MDGKHFPVGMGKIPSRDGKHFPVGMGNISHSGRAKFFPVETGMGNVFNWMFPSSDGKSSSVWMGNIFQSPAGMSKFLILLVLVGWFLCTPLKFLAKPETRKLGHYLKINIFNIK